MGHRCGRETWIGGARAAMNELIRYGYNRYNLNPNPSQDTW